MKRARECKVCKHQSRRSIEKMLRSGAKYVDVADRYGIDKRVISKHKKVCMDNNGYYPEKETPPETLVKNVTGLITDAENGTQVVGNVSSAIDAAFSINEWIKKMQKLHDYADRMLDAINDYLMDPDDNNKYFVGPRSEEVTVLYQELDERKRPVGNMLKKASLQELLNKVDDSDQYVIHRADYKHADPRNLLLDFIKVTSSLSRDLIDMRNKDIEWVLKAEKIRIERETLEREAGKSMTPSEMIAQVVKDIGQKMVDTAKANQDLMEKVPGMGRG